MGKERYACIPSRFRDAKITDLDPEVFPFVLDYDLRMTDYLSQRKGLVFSGPPGVGKTWAAAALTKRYAQRARNPSFHFETTYTLLERYAPVVASPATYDAERSQPWTTTYESVFWLVVNDLGKGYRGGKLYEQEVMRVGRLLRTRSERELITHITTNLPLTGDSSLETVYGESVMSLLHEMTEGWEVDGPDRRRG